MILSLQYSKCVQCVVKLLKMPDCHLPEAGCCVFVVVTVAIKRPI